MGQNSVSEVGHFCISANNQGSTVAVTDAAGSQKENIVYYPFGERRSETGTEPVNHKYTSQELDGETGLYNYNARLYLPEIGRFISPDSIVPDTANPQSLNRYSYVRNNPLNYVDPTGHMDLYCYSDTCGGGGGGGGGGTGNFKDDWDPWADRFESVGREFGRWGRDIGNFFDDLFGDLFGGDDSSAPPPYSSSNSLNSIKFPLINNFTDTPQNNDIASAMFNMPFGPFAVTGAVEKTSATVLKNVAGQIMPYKELRKLIRGTGLHAHHLSDQRFKALFDGLGVNYTDQAIALTKGAHQVFTNASRAAIKYGSETRNATKEQVMGMYKTIYSNYPEILRALGL